MGLERHRYAVRTRDLLRLLGVGRDGRSEMVAAEYAPESPDWLMLHVVSEWPEGQAQSRLLDAEVRIERVDLHDQVLVPSADWEECQERDQATATHADAGMQEILGERHRQEREEGFTPASDDERYSVFNIGDLARAALCYQSGTYQLSDAVHRIWPWATHWWKPTTTRRNVVKAGALYLSLAEWANRRVQECADQLAALDALENDGGAPDPRPDDADPREKTVRVAMPGGHTGVVPMSAIRNPEAISRSRAHGPHQ